MLAPRGFVVSDENSQGVYNHRFNVGGAHPIVSLKIEWWDADAPLVILPGVKKVTIESEDFNSDVELCEGVEELTFDYLGVFGRTLTIPDDSSLEVLSLSAMFDRPIDLVEGLEHVRFGLYFDQPVRLPTSLKQLWFDADSQFNHPIELPNGLKSARFNTSMKHAVMFPVGLEELEWYTDIPVTLPEGLERLTLGWCFRQPITLPASLREITYCDDYNLPLVLPPGCVRVN